MTDQKPPPQDERAKRVIDAVSPQAEAFAAACLAQREKFVGVDFEGGTVVFVHKDVPGADRIRAAVIELAVKLPGFSATDNWKKP
jgi:hypothetical protein